MTTTRRSFLATSAAAAVGLLDGFGRFSRLAGEDARAAATGMQLGLVTYNWGKDWDLPTLIKNCETTGYGGVELRSTHKHGVEITLSEGQRKEVASRFADSPVELVGLGSACEYHSPDPALVKKNIEETKAFVKLSQDIGGSGVKVRPNSIPPNVPKEKTLEQIGKSLNEVAKFAADHGQVIRVEVHGTNGAAELPNIQRMMEIADHPNALVCWNCNATDLIGEGLKHNFNLVKEKINTIHIHDLRSTSYPWKELFALLKAARFTGWAMIEEGNVPADIVAAMQENRVLWNKLVAE